MNAPRRQNGVLTTDRARRCESKRRYPDEVTVRAAGAHYMDAFKTEALWCYRCALCHGWHLTHKDNGRKGAIMPLTSDTARAKI